MCSYCGCRSITVIGRFSEEHDTIVNAAGELGRAVTAGDLPAVQRCADALRDLLVPHSGSEERGLFAELRKDPDFTDHVDRLCGEHREIAGQLADIAGGEFSRMAPFETLLRRHIDREENGLFPAAAVSLDGPAWEHVVANS
jgi:hypothetical protein